MGEHYSETKEKLPQFDALSCIASGGIEPMCFLRNIYPNLKTYPIRYSHTKRDDKKGKVPFESRKNYFRELQRGDKVLCVDDWSVTGKSFKYAKKTFPWGVKVYGTVVHTANVDRENPTQRQGEVPHIFPI